ncbi:flagellar hook assembly protein FlgD [Salidesulfovibrio onnuriiensis]|uniref:flagellar hook assembly protein FlgD n=1 Tax=Salidesulfovibrio onnuriiensis TaxID=2583823 RepID=UPI0011C80199|nr:flagellar hook capping FlgD N-terminal domain-containing protein [Salidesulfovibrio onnuriiensis]
MSYVNTGYILGQHEQYLAEANSPNQKKSVDQESFLTLLVAQLTHQDPMNPMEDTDMTSQLAEFSSLEQLTSINTGIENLGSAQERTDMLTAVSFIGKSVRASGYNISKEGTTVSKIFYGTGEALGAVKINVYDSDGAIVRTVEQGSKEPGNYEFEWDGRNAKGELVADGTYSVGILGEDTNGKPVMIRTEMSGEVSGIVQENGQSFLRLKDGRYVSFANVTEVVNTGSTDSGSETEESGS